MRWLTYPAECYRCACCKCAPPRVAVRKRLSPTCALMVFTCGIPSVGTRLPEALRRQERAARIYIAQFVQNLGVIGARPLRAQQTPITTCDHQNQFWSRASLQATSTLLTGDPSALERAEENLIPVPNIMPELVRLCPQRAAWVFLSWSEQLLMAKVLSNRSALWHSNDSVCRCVLCQMNYKCHCNE